MKYDKVNRRFFLQGAGGALLAVPFLPSLLSNEAHAQTLAIKPWISFARSGHGGFMDSLMPDIPLSSMRKIRAFSGGTDYPDHDIHIHDNLLSLKQVYSSNVVCDQDFDNGASRLSCIIGSFTPDSIIQKLTILRGLSVPFYMGHNYAQYLGNPITAVNGASSLGLVLKHRKTIDNILADHIYPREDRLRTTQDVLRLAMTGGSMSHGDPRLSKSELPTTLSMGSRPESLFKAIFEPTDHSEKEYVVDKFLEDYNTFAGGKYRRSHDKISTEDKNTLHRFMELIFKTEQTIKARPKFGDFMAQAPSLPANATVGNLRGDTTSESTFRRDLNTLAEILHLAYWSRTSRISVVNLRHFHGWEAGDWHQNVYHKHTEPDRQALVARTFRLHQESFYTYLASLCDGVTESNGKTLLDNGMIVGSWECGPYTHSNNDMWAMVFGGAGIHSSVGATKNKYYDFQNHLNMGLVPKWQPESKGRPGLPWNAFLADILKLYGVPLNQYLENGIFGDSYIANYTYNSTDPYPAPFLGQYGAGGLPGLWKIS
jgi:hypothetical protein